MNIISFTGFLLVLVSAAPLLVAQQNENGLFEILIKLDEKRVLSDAEKYLKYVPETITDFIAQRSSGGKHDYYSEGDYWWPDPANPEGPYIRKDGLTNPDNFTGHREAMRKLSIIVPALTAAFLISGDIKYADAAINHIDAWFINEDTKMNPNMRFAQAIKGRVTGRGIGIIDAIHLVEVVQAMIVLEEAELISPLKLNILKKWFGDFANWLMNDQFGIDERDNGNNHSTCWNMQVAEYSKFIGDEAKMNFCREHFKSELLPTQMKIDGSFPLELERTKPFGYSLFNLDAFVMVAQILSTKKDNLWEYSTPDGKNLKTALDFIYPYIKDKSTWPYQKDVMHFDKWPVRHPSLLFGSLAYGEKKYFELWKKLDPSPEDDEVLRNFFIRQPLLWIK